MAAYSHSRTQSAFPRTPSPLHNHTRSGSSSNTAYNGSEGRIGDIFASGNVDFNNYDGAQLAVPSRVATTTPRPALGARLLSSLSNAQPAAASLSRKGSVLHSRAKSLAAFVPKLSTSSASTPERARGPNPIFGDLFNGESAPIRIGAPVSPTKEKEETEFIMEYRSTFTERPGSLPRRNTAQSQNQPKATTAPTNAMSSWFSRRPTNPTPSKSPSQQQIPQDELATLNINTTLFPNGPADPLNPHAFNDLLLNATSLLQRMQTAYKEKLTYIASLQPELDAQKEEVEEAETRSRHLKLQLEDMGRQAQEREAAMQILGQQLAEEKIKVQEAREATRTIRLVETQDVPPRRRKRPSGGSASDSGFESDVEYAESVVSSSAGSATPGSPAPESSIDARMGDYMQQQRQRLYTLHRRPSTSTVSSAGDARPGTSGRRMGGEGAAWATVDVLRAENNDLRTQMEGMQMEMQGCIDLISALNGAV